MKYLLIIALLLTSACVSAGNNIIDSVGYRYYHDMDNEQNGSKFRAYATKEFYKSRLKFAYERKRTGRGVEAGTWFIDHAIKF